MTKVTGREVAAQFKFARFKSSYAWGPEIFQELLGLDPPASRERFQAFMSTLPFAELGTEVWGEYIKKGLELPASSTVDKVENFEHQGGIGQNAGGMIDYEVIGPEDELVAWFMKTYSDDPDLYERVS